MEDTSSFSWRGHPQREFVRSGYKNGLTTAQITAQLPASTPIPPAALRSMKWSIARSNASTKQEIIRATEETTNTAINSNTSVASNTLSSNAAIITSAHTIFNHLSTNTNDTNQNDLEEPAIFTDVQPRQPTPDSNRHIQKRYTAPIARGMHPINNILDKMKSARVVDAMAIKNGLPPLNRESLRAEISNVLANHENLSHFVYNGGCAVVLDWVQVGGLTQESLQTLHQFFQKAPACAKVNEVIRELEKAQIVPHTAAHVPANTPAQQLKFHMYTSKNTRKRTSNRRSPKSDCEKAKTTPPSAESQIRKKNKKNSPAVLTPTPAKKFSPPNSTSHPTPSPSLQQDSTPSSTLPFKKRSFARTLAGKSTPPHDHGAKISTNTPHSVFSLPSTTQSQVDPNLTYKFSSPNQRSLAMPSPPISPYVSPASSVNTCAPTTSHNSQSTAKTSSSPYHSVSFPASSTNQIVNTSACNRRQAFCQPPNSLSSPATPHVRSSARTITRISPPQTLPNYVVQSTSTPSAKSPQKANTSRLHLPSKSNFSPSRAQLAYSKWISQEVNSHSPPTLPNNVSPNRNIQSSPSTPLLPSPKAASPLCSSSQYSNSSPPHHPISPTTNNSSSINQASNISQFVTCPYGNIFPVHPLFLPSPPRSQRK